MKRVTLRARRREETFRLDSSRVITKAFIPGGPDRIRDVINRVLRLSDIDVEQILEGLKRNFEGRHKDIWEVFRENFEQVRHFVPQEQTLSDNKRLLIGSYFTQ